MSVSEKAAFEGEMAAAQSLLEEIRSAKDDLAVMEKAREISDQIGGTLDGGPLGHPAPPTGTDRRLSFKGMGARLVRDMRPESGKALSPSGAAVVVQEFINDPVALGKPALSLLDVIPVIQHSTPEISYLRQSTGTNNAAVVNAGALKPTSVYSVTRVENSLAGIAHLSEGIPRHWLLDNTSLEVFLDNELRYGLAVAVEAKVISDVNGTTGIQTPAYATSVLATIRHGVTLLESSGYLASAFVLHPTDWEAVELGLSTTNSIEHMGLPYDASRRSLFGVPIVVSTAQTAGVGHAVALDTDSRGVDVQWSENATADSFGKNLVFARCESRYATSVFSPLGVVKLDLTP
jgi:HK97 family phage major capsid protein